MTSCLTGLELNKQVKPLLIQLKQSSQIETKKQEVSRNSDPSPEVSILRFYCTY